MKQLDDVPVVDFSASKLEVARQIKDAASKYGFFYVLGHSVSAGERKETFQCSKEFFGLESDVKSSIPICKGGFTRGYIGVGGESGSNRYELKEGFSYGFDWDPAETPRNGLQGPNNWPQPELVSIEWRNTMNRFYTQMIETCKQLCNGLSLSLGKDEDCFSKFCTEGDTISLMRFFHYLPSASYSGDLQPTGSSSHTDWGFLTLIMQDTTGGLQVSIDDVWYEIPPKEGALFVNMGDYLSIMTGGRYISPLHKVVLHPDEHRYSMVLFYYPNYTSKLFNSDVMCQDEVIGGEDRDGNAGENGAEHPAKKRKSDHLNRLSILKDQNFTGWSDEAAQETTSMGSNQSVGEQQKGTDSDATIAKEKDTIARSAADEPSSTGGSALNRDVSFGEYIMKKWGSVFRG